MQEGREREKGALSTSLSLFLLRVIVRTRRIPPKISPNFSFPILTFFLPLSLVSLTLAELASPLSRTCLSTIPGISVSLIPPIAMRLGVTMTQAQASSSSSSAVAAPPVDFGSRRRHRRPRPGPSRTLPALSAPRTSAASPPLSLLHARRSSLATRAAAAPGSGGDSSTPKPPTKTPTKTPSSTSTSSSSTSHLPPAPVRLSSTSTGYYTPTSFKADPARPGRPSPVSQELLDACEKLGMPHPKTWLFDPATGLALIRKKLTYAELLRDVRLGRIQTVALFDPEHKVYDAMDLEMYSAYGKTPPGSDGAAIVQYREGFYFGDEEGSDKRIIREDDPALLPDNQEAVSDDLYPAGGVVATANVPPYDARLAAAFEAHGVSVERLPCPGDKTAFFMEEPVKPSPYRARFYQALPYILLVATYCAAQFGAWLKGDFEDRNLMRKADVAKEKAQAEQLRRDEARLELEQLAAAGYSAEAIMAEARRVGRPAKEAYVKALVEAFKEGAGKELAPPPKSSSSSSSSQKKKKDPFDGDPDAYAEALRKAALAKLAKMQGGADSDEAKEAAIGRISTVQIQKASEDSSEKGQPADAEVWDDDASGAALRKAQRQLKGVKLQYVGSGKVLFDDVAGVEGAKRELAEVVDFFTKPERFRSSGAKVPRGVLLFGPPGTGKTLLARAVAGEAGVSFLSLNASEFVEMFVGVGASRVRDLFAQARALAPAVIFIDEIDAVGRKRGGGQGNDERDATLNQLLTEMDGFSTEQDVIVIGATNRADVLDEALLRPGRFDRIATVQEADADGRVAILKLHLGWEEGEGGSKRKGGGGGEEGGNPTSNKPPLPRHRRCDGSVDLQKLAEGTVGFSGAALAALVNDAALRAARDSRDFISMEDLEIALEENLLGVAKPAFDDARGPRLALVEATAAVSAVLLSPPLERLLEVTIVPRDKWPYGQTVLESDEDREKAALFTRSYLLAQLVAALSPYAAERLFRGPQQQSMLASRRLARGRRIVDRMVAGAGIGGAGQGGSGRDFLSVVLRKGRDDSSSLPPPVYSSEPSSRMMGGEWRTVAIPAWFGGRTLAQVVPSRVSRGTHAAAAADAQALFEEGLTAAEALVARNRGAIEAVAQALLDKKTLKGSDVRRIIEAEGDKEDVARCKREKGMFY